LKAFQKKVINIWGIIFCPLGTVSFVCRRLDMQDAQGKSYM